MACTVRCILQVLFVTIVYAQPELNTTTVTTAEVCQMETFRASCSRPDEVIVVRSAQLGRLRIGRCILEGFGYMGCSLDVLPELDSFCSGRRKCQVKIDDTSFKRSIPCHRDLKNHLTVTYQCIKVVAPTEGCGMVSGRSGSISSQVTEDTGCGQTDSPWTIQVGIGQRINITLHDFSFEASQYPETALPFGDRDELDESAAIAATVTKARQPTPQLTYPKTCRVYATIREMAPMGRSVTVCGSQGKVVNVFTSTTDKIEIRILASKSPSSSKPGLASSQKDAQFLLNYEAIGCADPDMSPGMWRKRSWDGDTITVGCEDSGMAWKLTCKGKVWEGSFENCTNPDKLVSTGQSFAVGFSSVVIAFIAIVVSALILVIGILCIKWSLKRDQEKHIHSPDVGPVANYRYDYESQYNVDLMNNEKSAIEPYAGSYLQEDANGNDYARMRLQQQRLTHVIGSARYDYPDDIQAYGEGMRVPATEHIYESPDSLNLYEPETDSQYTPRIGQAGESLLRHQGPSESSNRGGVVAGAGDRGCIGSGRLQNCPTPSMQTAKAKSVGNYSL